MVATFDWKLLYGGTDGNPTEVTITNLRYRTDDANTADTSNPVPIVAGLTKRSYVRAMVLKCTAPPSSYCNNFKLYTDGGGFGTGITVQIGDQTVTNTGASHANYKVATGTPGDTGTIMTTVYAAITTMTSLFTYTSAAPRTVTVSETSNQIDAADEETDLIITQLDMADTATPGTKTAETYTGQYDEV